MLPYRYIGNLPFNTFFEGLDGAGIPSNDLNNDILALHQQQQSSPPTTPNTHTTTATSSLIPQLASSASSVSTTSSTSKTSKISRNSIDGSSIMANLTPSLLSSTVPSFSQAQQQQLQQTTHQSGAMQPQMLQQQTQSRSRVKNRSSNHHTPTNIGLNGLAANLPAQQIFGTSVAFPGNPLQSGSQGQNQNYSHQSRLNQMQHTAGQQSAAAAAAAAQQAVLLPLDINPSQATRNLVSNSSGSTITSNTHAAVAAAVAVAHPQYTQYITSWPCPACKVAFRSANELQTHLSAHFVPSQKQTPSGQNLVSSNTIQQNFNNNTANNKTTATTKDDQSIHMKKEKSVPCNECGKLFANAERVRVHVRVAHGEKTCSCTICGCGFSYRCKLLNHMRTHTGDKPFTCEVCGRSFSQKNHLKRHHMIHTGERPFPCEICGRSFYRKDKLTRHLRIHTNPSPGRGRNAKMPASLNQQQNLVKTTSTTNSAHNIGGQTSSWAQIQQSTANNDNNTNNQRQNNQTNNLNNKSNDNDNTSQQQLMQLKREM